MTKDRMYPGIRTGIVTGKVDKSLQTMKTQFETDGYDTKEKLERTDTGYRLTIESTRGTGTRDQDKVKVEGRAETWDKLDSQRTAMRTAVCVEMNQRRLHHPDEELDE